MKSASKNINLSGTAARPRASVFRSNKQISVQFIDDQSGKTLVSQSSDKIKGAKMTPVEAAREVGKTAAGLLSAKKINEIIFDRGTYQYHGRVQALAEGLREGGIKF